MRIQILPERPAVDLDVRGAARANGLGERGPRVDHTSAEAIEIQAEAQTGIEQPSGVVVQRERPWLGFGEDAFGDELAQHAGQSLGISLARGGKVGNGSGARLQVARDVQSRDGVQGPGSGEIGERPEIHGSFSVGFAGASPRWSYCTSRAGVTCACRTRRPLRTPL